MVGTGKELVESKGTGFETKIDRLRKVDIRIQKNEKDCGVVFVEKCKI